VIGECLELQQQKQVRKCTHSTPPLIRHNTSPKYKARKILTNTNT
jgi:hypothetical protein